MSYVIRFVECDYDTGTANIIECFLGFLQLDKKDAASTAEVITDQLRKDELDLLFCRSQCYDNAAVMSGERGGLQAIMQRASTHALFLNCNNHSLNLVGFHSTKDEPVLGAFYGCIDSLYNFFSRSTIRWKILEDAIGRSLHSQSETRWSARHDVVKPVYERFQDILNVLEDMSENESLNADTRQDAFALSQRLASYDFIFLLKFWYILLVKIDTVQKRLQSPQMNFKEASCDIDGLHQFFCDSRDSIGS